MQLPRVRACVRACVRVCACVRACTASLEKLGFSHELLPHHVDNA